MRNRIHSCQMGSFAFHADGMRTCWKCGRPKRSRAAEAAAAAAAAAAEAIGP